MAKKTTSGKTAKKKPAKKTTARKPAAKKTTVKKISVKKPAAKKTASKKKPAKKTTAGKPSAKKATAKKTSVKKRTTKKPAAKKKTTKKAVSKKQAVRKAAPKKTASKKTASKKAVAKKPTKKTSSKKPVAKKTASKKPVIKKTVKKKSAVKKTEAKNLITTTWISADKYRESVKVKLLSHADKKAGVKLTNEDLAKLYLLEAKYESLLELSKKVLEQKETKNSPLWLERQSESYCRLGLWKEAMEVNKKRTSLFPKELSAWNTLAIVYAVLGDIKAAAGKLKEAEGKINWEINYEKPDINKKPQMKEEFYAVNTVQTPAIYSDIFWPRNAMVILYPKIMEKAGDCAAGWYTLAKFYGDNLHYYEDAAKAVDKALVLKPDWKPAVAYKEQMSFFLDKINAKDN